MLTRFIFEAFCVDVRTVFQTFIDIDLGLFLEFLDEDEVEEWPEERHDDERVSLWMRSIYSTRSRLSPFEVVEISAHQSTDARCRWRWAVPSRSAVLFLPRMLRPIDTAKSVRRSSLLRVMNYFVAFG